jgi:ADP-ribose pyrophosphatase
MKERRWEIISSERHFANAHLEVVTDLVRTPARSDPHTWTVVHRKAAVVIAPMTRDGKIILLRQERIPIREAIWEMPSGQIDSAVAGDADAISAQETMEQVALRELREEAGYELAKDGELVSLGHFHRRDLLMSAATSFWRVQFSGVKRARRETKENRFSIAAHLPWRKFAA